MSLVAAFQTCARLLRHPLRRRLLMLRSIRTLSTQSWQAT